MKSFPILLTYLSLGIGSWPAIAAGTNENSTNSLIYSEILKCGPNSLFMFLILSGHSEVNLEQLQKLPVSSEGVSLLALRDAARKSHVDAEIRSYRPEEINLLPLPAIGQFTTLHSIVFRLISGRYSKSWIAVLIIASSALPRCVCGQPATDSAGAGRLADQKAIKRLPPDAIEQLNKQAKAMEVVYLEFTQLLAAPSLDDGAVRKAYFVYFEGSHFYDRTQRLRKRAGQLILHNHDVWFDGDILYVGDSDGTSAFFPGVTTKYLIADATEPERPKKRWEFPHLDAAGFYAPERMTELQQWLSVESMVLRYLKQSDSTIVEEAGENLRLTVVVPDRFLVGAREMDIEWLRKTLDPRLSSPDLIAKEIEMYERARKLKPEQTVTFLLDPKHGYGVAEREETNAEGQRTLRVTSEDWKYYESAGIWLPTRCVGFIYLTSFYEVSDEPVRTNTTELKLAEFGRKKTEFALSLKSDYKKRGTVVIDRTVAESRARPDHEVVYTVAANGTLLHESTRNVMNRVNYFWLILLGILALPPIALLIQHMKNRGKIGK